MGWRNVSELNGLHQMTKMAAMPIYGKNFKIFSGTKRQMTLKLCIRYWLLEYCRLCSDDDLGSP